MADTMNNPDAKWDYVLLLQKKRLCRQLNLYDLEKGTDSFELRFWGEPALFTKNELFILKGKANRWQLYYYTFYCHNILSDTVMIDSMHAKTIIPFGNNWSKYINSLCLDSLWHTPSQCELKNKVGVFDGWSCTIEMADRKRFKLIHYDNPDADSVEKNNRFIMSFIHNFCKLPDSRY